MSIVCLLPFVMSCICQMPWRNIFC